VAVGRLFLSRYLVGFLAGIVLGGLNLEAHRFRQCPPQEAARTLYCQSVAVMICFRVAPLGCWSREMTCAFLLRSRARGAAFGVLAFLPGRTFVGATSDACGGTAARRQQKRRTHARPMLKARKGGVAKTYRAFRAYGAPGCMRSRIPAVRILLAE
jgi:hypothetical protein